MANTTRDYYEILGVSKDANKDEIKRAYRKLAMKYHPDVNKDNPDAEKHFMEVNEAYEVLSDPKKRATYDQFGHAGVDGQTGGFGGFEGLLTIIELDTFYEYDRYLYIHSLDYKTKRLRLLNNMNRTELQKKL